MVDTLLRSFLFNVRLDLTPRPSTDDPTLTTPFTDGGFQEVTGLEIELDVLEYLEGGRNDGAARCVGRAKYQPLLLKRGMFYGDSGVANRAFWQWLQSIAAGARPVPRCNGVIQVMRETTAASEVAAVWTFDRGLPVRVRGPQLNAKTGEIAIEELHIAHEGLRLSA